MESKAGLFSWLRWSKDGKAVVDDDFFLKPSLTSKNLGRTRGTQYGWANFPTTKPQVLVASNGGGRRGIPSK